MNHVSRRTFVAGIGGAAALTQFAPAFAADATAPQDVAFVESSAADLAGLKRVVVSNFVLSFQTQAKVTKEGGKFINRNDMTAWNYWKNVDTAVLQQIADGALAGLKGDLKAKGLEVLDEAALKNVPAYQNIVAKMGYDNYAQYGNRDGAATFVSASTLTPYQNYALEMGNWDRFENTQGFTKGTGNLPSAMKGVGVWQLPGWEIETAKALDAALVKAFYVVNFSELEAGSSISDFGRADLYDWDGDGYHEGTVEYSAQARAFARLRQDITRIAFRLPNSAKKMGYKVSNYPDNKINPPKDGDVVINIGKPVPVGSKFFEVAEGEAPKIGLLGLGGGNSGNASPFSIKGPRGQGYAAFNTSVTDYDLYQKALSGNLSKMQHVLIDAAFPA